MLKWIGVLVLQVVLAASLGQAQEKREIPEKPFDLRVSSRIDGAVAVAILTWRDESKGELGFEIRRSDGGRDYRVVATVGSNTVRYEDKIGKYTTGAFTYKVRAFNEAGKSDDSNPASVWF